MFFRRDRIGSTLKYFIPQIARHYFGIAEATRGGVGESAWRMHWTCTACHQSRLDAIKGESEIGEQRNGFRK